MYSYYIVKAIFFDFPWVETSCKRMTFCDNTCKSQDFYYVKKRITEMGREQQSVLVFALLLEMDMEPQGHARPEI